MIEAFVTKTPRRKYWLRLAAAAEAIVLFFSVLLLTQNHDLFSHMAIAGLHGNAVAGDAQSVNPASQGTSPAANGVATSPVLDAAESFLVKSQDFADQNNLPEAIRNLEQYLALRPKDTRLYSALANLYFARQDYGAAARHFTTYLNQYNGTDAQAYFMRATCYAQTEDYQLAIDDFRSAAKFGHDQVACFENIVICQLCQKDYAAVLATGETIAQNGQASATLYQQMGVSAMALDQTERAITYLTQSIEADPMLEKGYFYRGTCYMSDGNIKSAIADFSASIAQGDVPQLCYYNRGLCRLQQKKYEEARLDLELAIKAGDDAALIDSARKVLGQLD